MPRLKRTGIVLAAIAAAAAPAAPDAAASEKLIVFAAASLKTALDRVNEACAPEVGERATISYAGSSALAKQIEQGAPADIFISADLDWMAYLSERELIRKETETKLLGNRIVLIAPTNSGVAIEMEPSFDLAGLLGDGRLAIANVAAVPAGKYGKASLQALGAWDAVADRLAQAENVRAALALVATGEAPLGVVYKTDAAAEAKVEVVGTFPEDSHPPIVYPAAQTAESGSALAPAFMKCLRSAEAKALFEDEGFAVLVPPASN